MNVQTLMQIEPYLPESVFSRLVLTAPKVYPLIHRIRVIHEKRPRNMGTAILAIAAVAFFIFIAKAQSYERSDLNPDGRVQPGWTAELRFPCWVFGWLLPTHSFTE